MTNTELLKSWGFIENNGWLCSPYLNREEIFQIGEIDNKEMSYLIHCISSTAFNAGSRYKEEQSKANLVKELENIIKKVKKS